jgi:hypothetical protein
MLHLRLIISFSFHYLGCTYIRHNTSYKYHLFILPPPATIKNAVISRTRDERKNAIMGMMFCPARLCVLPKHPISDEKRKSKSFHHYLIEMMNLQRPLMNGEILSHVDKIQFFTAIASLSTPCTKQFIVNQLAVGRYQSILFAAFFASNTVLHFIGATSAGLTCEVIYQSPLTL